MDNPFGARADPAGAVASSPSVRFRERLACPVCGNSGASVVWEGPMLQTPVDAWLSKYRYACDLHTELAGASLSLAKCTSCTLLYHRNVLTPESLKTLYSGWIDDAQIEQFGTHDGALDGALDGVERFEAARQRVKHVLRVQELLGPLDRPTRWLDFGSGDGEQLTIAALFGYDAYGIDFSTTRTRRAAGITTTADFAGFDELGVDSVDVASAFQVLEHVEDVAEVLNQLAQRLRPGAVLIVEVPDASGISVPTTFEQFQAVHPLEHINAFTPDTLRSTCERFGFAAVKRRPPAHVTTRPGDVLRAGASRFVGSATTNQYFIRQ
jgi:2-polyprenyl-3-methyl-5-hydroxy-6-metoxy-1,4-benzoquinol methylase